jgi:hypothetical protein
MRRIKEGPKAQKEGLGEFFSNGSLWGKNTPSAVSITAYGEKAGRRISIINFMFIDPFFMTRLKAFIVLIPLLALLVEGVFVASACSRVADIGGRICDKSLPGIDCCKKHNKTLMGTTALPAKGVMNEKSAKTGEEEKDAKRNGNGKGCLSFPCLNCPLCCVVVFKPTFRIGAPGLSRLVEYSVMPAHTLSDYSSQPWRPPNI